MRPRKPIYSVVMSSWGQEESAGPGHPRASPSRPGVRPDAPHLPVDEDHGAQKAPGAALPIHMQHSENLQEADPPAKEIPEAFAGSGSPVGIPEPCLQELVPVHEILNPSTESGSLVEIPGSCLQEVDPYA